MGRTPNYNKGNGKDHWSIGSIMFLGPGHQGQPRHRRHRREAVPRAARPADAGLPTKDGVRVRPEHIHTALREFAGIADHAFSKKFPLGVADKERLRGLWG